MMEEKKKKKSSSRTGNQYQDWCVGILKEWFPKAAIHNQKATAKFLPYLQKWVSQRNDILGCIDIVIIDRDNAPGFIQCTCHKSFTEKFKELEKIPWPLEHVSVQVWMKRAPGRTEIRSLVNNPMAGLTLMTLGEIRKRIFCPTKDDG
jgi:hypothetical protein